VFVLFLLGVYPVLHLASLSSKKLQLLVCSGSLVIWAGCVFALGWHIWPKIKVETQSSSNQPAPAPSSPPVYVPFQHIYNLRQERLGKPRASEEAVGDTYQGIFDYAVALWLERPLEIIGLPRDPATPVKWEHDANFETDPKWFDEGWLRKKFHTPSGRYSPGGGIGQHWDKWSWMGFPKWACYFGQNTIKFQEFERGTITGIFCVEPNHKGEVFVLYGDNKDYTGWEPEEVDSKCDPVWTHDTPP
jgi:hypothetical protein